MTVYISTPLGSYGTRGGLDHSEVSVVISETLHLGGFSKAVLTKVRKAFLTGVCHTEAGKVATLYQIVAEMYGMPTVTYSANGAYGRINLHNVPEAFYQDLLAYINLSSDTGIDGRWSGGDAVIHRTTMDKRQMEDVIRSRLKLHISGYNNNRELALKLLEKGGSVHLGNK